MEHTNRVKENILALKAFNETVYRGMCRRDSMYVPINPTKRYLRDVISPLMMLMKIKLVFVKKLASKL